MFLKQCEVESRVEYFKGDIQEIIKSRKTIKKWAYILHDKDDTEDHYHIYLNFGNSGVDTKQVAEWFGLQESQVSKIKGRAVDMLKYLTHGNESQKNKYQYSPSEVVANFDFESEIKASEVLGDFTVHSYAEQLEYIHGCPRSEQVKLYNDLEKRWKGHCKWLTLHPERNMKVIFICGKGGTGKTTYAKRLLKSQGLDFCISSSSNDPLQDYMGQKAILLDDFRDRCFKNFEDLLKFLDNHTASSVQSRFANKVFNGEMIIITSSVPLRYWYHGKNADGKYFSVSQEDFIQLYRRISCYVEVTETEINVFDEIDDKGNPYGLARVFKNDIAEKKKQSEAKTDFGAMFEKICEPATTDIFDIQQLRIDGTEKQRGKSHK